MHERFIEEILADPVAFGSLFESVLASFTLQEVGIGHHNAAGFFAGEVYRLDLSVYRDAPFLMATRVH